MNRTNKNLCCVNSISPTENGPSKGSTSDNQQERQVPANTEGDKANRNQPLSNDLTHPKQVVEVAKLSYKELTIKIFSDGNGDKNNNSRRFFFEPIVVLDPTSVIIQSQELFKEDVVRFTIQMWSPEIRLKVLDRLRLKNLEVDEDDISVMPYEDVQLVGKPGSIHQSIKIMEEATSYHRLNEKLDFFLLCDSPSTAKVLAENLRRYPDFVVRKWQLALECHGLALDPSINDDNVVMKRPLFKLLVATFPTVGPAQDDCVAKETIAVQSPLEGPIDLKTQIQSLASKTNNSTSIIGYDQQIKSLQAQIHALSNKKSGTVFPVFSVSECTNANGLIRNQPLYFSSFEILNRKEYGEFDLKTGIFTVKKAGVFQFNFTGLAKITIKSPHHHSELLVDGCRKATSFLNPTVLNGCRPVFLLALLPLVIGQKVSINLVSGELYDTPDNRTSRLSCLYFASN